MKFTRTCIALAAFAEIAADLKNSSDTDLRMPTQRNNTDKIPPQALQLVR
jgi:hypothetical protein